MKYSINVSLTKSLGAVGEITVQLQGDRMVSDGEGLVEFEAIVTMGHTMIGHYMEHHATNQRLMNEQAQLITKTMPAIEIRVTMEKGKRYWKVATPEYSEFGIPFWPEHMKACGIDPKQIPDDGYICKEGTTAVIEMVDGKPKRVLKLVRPVQP